MNAALTSAIHARLTDDQRAEWDRLGSADWLRAALDLSAKSSCAGIALVREKTGVLYKFEPLNHWCAVNGVPVHMAECPVNGEASAWPAKAWLEVHGVDLSGLFGGWRKGTQNE